MRSTFSGIELSKRSLFAELTALQTTGHNIANANTRGYSRQVVNFVATRPLEYPGLMRSNTPGQIGQGVEFDRIYRIREKFLDDQYRNENKNLGDWSVRKDTLQKLEAIINEPTDTGIRQVIQNFWNAWQELSKAPDNLTARAVVKESALALVDAFNHTAKQLQDLSNDITDNINVKVSQINTILDQIARLNQEIYRIEGLGNDANDLRDQRDVLVDDLSRIVNISVTETEQGYTIRMGNVELVSGNTATQVSAASLATAYQTGDLNSGEVYGMILSRDVFVASYREQLDTMVRTLVEGDVQVTLPAGTVVPNGTVINGVTYSGTIAQRTLASDTTVTVKGINGLHQLGYTLTDPPAKGEPFFVMKPGASSFSAESITVNPLIANNVENIAASMRTYMDGATEKVVAGNNSLALLMAGLKNAKFDFDPANTGQTVLNGGTMDEFFRAIVGEIGVQTQEAERQTDNQQLLVDQVEARRQSISGVSLDEEMANMIKFQHAYNAAARALTTFDELLDKLINGTGVVGR
jgi:flagellar hook-associated protein 1 FlgK